MKILLPLGAVAVFGACCCCPGLEEVLQQQMGGGYGSDPWDGGGSDWGGGGLGAFDGRSMSSLPAGERVTILDVSSEDAYYADRYGMIGKSCTTQEYTSFKDGGWHGGSVRCADGTDYYFYKAALRDDGYDTNFGSGSSGYAVPPAGVALSAVPIATRVKIVDLSPEDAYYPDKATIVGKHSSPTR